MVLDSVEKGKQFFLIFFLYLKPLYNNCDFCHYILTHFCIIIL